MGNRENQWEVKGHIEVKHNALTITKASGRFSRMKCIKDEHATTARLE